MIHKLIYIIMLQILNELKVCGALKHYLRTIQFNNMKRFNWAIVGKMYKNTFIHDFIVLLCV